MKPKSYVIRAICFLLVFGVCFFTAQEILKSNSNNTRRMNGLYAEDDNSLDVLYVGASQVETFISPVQIYSQFGITGYDLCFDGTSIGLYKLLIEEAMQTQNPKALVISLIVTDEPTNEQVRAVLDNMRWSTRKMNAIKEYGNDAFSTFVFPISYYHSRWKNISPALGYTYFMLTENKKYNAWDSYSLTDLYLKKIYPLKGFYTSDKAIDFNIVDSWKKTDKKVSPGDSYMKMLDELLDYLDDLECEVVFINTPAPYANTSQNQMQINYAGDYLRQRGYTFIDYCDGFQEWGFDFSSDMGDKNHANIYGSIKFSNTIGEYLKTNLIKTIPEKSKETKENWDNALSAWNNCLKYYDADNQ